MCSGREIQIMTPGRYTPMERDEMSVEVFHQSHSDTKQLSCLPLSIFTQLFVVNPWNIQYERQFYPVLDQKSVFGIR